MIIFDIGSGNTLRNTEEACKIIKTIRELNINDSYVKFQLFRKAGNNIPLSEEVFERATRYCHIVNMPYGVSVFDEPSLDLAIHSGALCFLKLANNKELHHLISKAPDVDRWIISTDDPDYKIDRPLSDIIYCVSKYPATNKEYETRFGDKLKLGISDHTNNFGLFHKYLPKIYEFHFRLSETVGLDSGEFAKTEEQVKESLIKSKKIDLEEVLRTAQ
jgi:hypothetical protein